MQQIERIEAGRGGPFRVRADGQVHVMPDPAHLDFMDVLLRLQLRHLPEIPSCPEWQRARVFEAWSAHYDLPPFGHAQRLAYLVDHYADELTYDFRTVLHGLDFGEMWRSRRWATMLALIDRLPSHSWYSDAVSRDPEHLEMLTRAMAEQAESEDDDTSKARPSWIGWTPEMSALVRVHDEIRRLSYLTIATQGGQAKPPEPSPQPEHPMQVAARRAEVARRKRKHEALVARLLPHKARREP